MPITVGPFYLTHPVNFPRGRKPEYPGKTHDFRQSVDFYSFHTRTGFESHWESSHWGLNLRPQRWKASALTTWSDFYIVSTYMHVVLICNMQALNFLSTPYKLKLFPYWQKPPLILQSTSYWQKPPLMIAVPFFSWAYFNSSLQTSIIDFLYHNHFQKLLGHMQF
jgi:hypothetical protein